MLAHPHTQPRRSYGAELEVARRDGDALSRGRSLANSGLCTPGKAWGYRIRALPSGTVADRELEPFLHRPKDGSRDKALRLQGVATAME
jgi:hypothetical protein